MEHAFAHLLHLLAGHPAWTLTVVFLAAFLEAIAIIGTFIPGSTAMFLAGALVAYFGERDHRFRFNVISESGGR
ncbi:hypothetical protein [Caballeronia choica]|jgi:membrane protein DedA with SNARE-associated domain|uniref:hypothetical protein n=1 Tax=Caballeronia choica TaxID=326476 RepID=UPI000B3E8B4A|nr:hypothetical protein [Caballeronia choica]